MGDNRHSKPYRCIVSNFYFLYVSNVKRRMDQNLNGRVLESRSLCICFTQYATNADHRVYKMMSDFAKSTHNALSSANRSIP